MNGLLDAEDALLSELVTRVADGLDVDPSLGSSLTASESGHEVIREVQVVAALAKSIRSGDTEARVGSHSVEDWGSLRILGEVGRGSFGRVFRAWDTRLEREVALKLFDAVPVGGESSLLAEARLLARIRHENVVTVFGADRVGSQVGFWMEFIEGRTLKAMEDDRGPFSASEALLIARDICRALASVHRAGLVHGDVKAQNVIRQTGGRIVLTDFGAARFVKVSAGDPRRTTVTPLYAAPEVLLGGSPTVASDLYSLGVLLYYLVAGAFPVNGASIDDFRDAHASRRRTLLRDVRPDLPAAFIRLVDAATAVRPEERPTTAGAFEALLDDAARRTGAGDALVGHGAARGRATGLYSMGLYCWN